MCRLSTTNQFDEFLGSRNFPFAEIRDLTTQISYAKTRLRTFAPTQSAAANNYSAVWQANPEVH